MRLSLDPIRRLFVPPADRRLAAALATPAPPPPGGPRTLEPAGPGMPPRVALERADLGMGARMRLWRDEQRHGIRTPWLPVGLHWRFEDMEMVWESAEIGTMLPLARMVEAMRSEAIISGLMGARSSFITKPVTYSGDPWLADWLRGKPALYIDGRMAEREAPARFLLMFPRAALLDLLWTGTLAGVAVAELVDDPVLGLPVAQTRDLHRVRYDWGERVWKYLGETAEYVIEPGNGRWILFMPYATHRPWRSGSWLPLALAFIVMQTATYDAGRFQATNADPLKYIELPDSAPPEEGDKLEEFVQLWWERNPRAVLRFGAKAGIVESNGQGYQIYEKQRTWAKQQINFTLRGSTATSGDAEGIFNDPAEAYEVAEQIIQQSADALAECVCNQGVAPTLKRFGLIQRRAEAPGLAWDTRSPTRKVKEASAVGQVCDVVTKLDALGEKRGRLLDIDDFFQRAGLTVKWLEISPEAAQLEEEPADPEGGRQALPDAPSPPQLPPARPVDSVVEQTRPDGSLASRAREVRKRRRKIAARAGDDDPSTTRRLTSAKWDEDKHKRGADGKFGEGGGANDKPAGGDKPGEDALRRRVIRDRFVSDETKNQAQELKRAQFLVEKRRSALDTADRAVAEAEAKGDERAVKRAERVREAAELKHDDAVLEHRAAERALERQKEEDEIGRLHPDDRIQAFKERAQEARDAAEASDAAADFASGRLIQLERDLDDADGLDREAMEQEIERHKETIADHGIAQEDAYFWDLALETETRRQAIRQERLRRTEDSRSAPGAKARVDQIEQSVLKGGLVDSELRYGRDPTSFREASLEHFRQLYSQGRAEGKSATEVALAQPPIEISLWPDGKLALADGRHRYVSALKNGAERIPATLIRYDKSGATISETTTILPLRRG